MNSGRLIFVLTTITFKSQALVQKHMIIAHTIDSSVFFDKEYCPERGFQFKILLIMVCASFSEGSVVNRLYILQWQEDVS